MKNYPKVLLITHNSFNFNLNNGKTFNSLFYGWDSNSIAQLFFLNEVPESHFCKNYFRITDKDVLKKLFSIASETKCGNKLNSTVTNYAPPSHSTASGMQSFKSRLKRNIFIKVLRDLIWSKNSWKTNALKNWLIDFKPEVILLGVGNYEFSAKIAFWISEFLDIPLCLYYGDDYILNPSYKWGIYKFQYNKVKKAHDRNVKHSNKLIAIGDLMASEYQKAYGKEVNVIMTSVDLEDYIYKKENSSTDTIIISYLGGLHLNRWKSIIELGKLLQKIQSSVSRKIIFNIYSMSILSESIMANLNEGPLNFCGSVSGDVVKNIMQNSDILVHVESFDEKYRKLTSLSISTKIPEYLSSGKCILGFGPNEVASIRIFSENSIGLCLTDEDSKYSKISKLIQLLTSSRDRQLFGDAARSYAKNNFDRKINNENLRLALIDAIEPKR